MSAQRREGRFSGMLSKYGGQLDVGRFRVPLVDIALGNGHGLPVRVSLETLRCIACCIALKFTESANRRFRFLVGVGQMSFR